MTLHRPLARVSTALASVLLLLGTVAGPSASAADAVRLDPAKLGRSAEVAGPHLTSLDSTTIVDGDRRVRVDADAVQLLGKVDGRYVVVAYRGDAEPVLSVATSGAETVVVADLDGAEPTLDERFAQLTVQHPASTTRTRIDVVDVRSGTRTSSKTFRGSVRVLDMRRDLAVVGGDDVGTATWDLTAGTARTVTRRLGYRADLATNRLATFDGDPYEGGCSVLTTLDQPRTTLWRSCGERVEAFSPDGRRVAAVHILSDGLGAGRASVVSTRGYRLATYDTAYYFGGLRFESDKALLLSTYGRSKAAVVRCVGSTCGRATAVSDTPEV